VNAAVGPERAAGGASQAPAPGPQRSGRALGLACIGLALAAALLWGASATVWFRATPPGRAPVVADGATALPSLTGVALVALAGIAAVVATAGLVRRALACLLGLAGVAVAGFAVAAALAPALPADAPPAGATDAVRPAVTAAPLLAVAGGLVLAGVGVFVLLNEPRMARLGARYAAAGTRPTVTDPDRAAWVALDEGRDPTVDPAAGPAADSDDPGGGRAGGAV
jgi:Tryptophan-associated transmembrane protein (Trp_oprn_chp)